MRSQRTSWVNLSPLHRGLAAFVADVPLGLLAGAIAALAGGPWVMLGFGAAALGILALLPHVVMPERMLRASARTMTPEAESMKRGDSNKNWPG